MMTLLVIHLCMHLQLTHHLPNLSPLLSEKMTDFSREIILTSSPDSPITAYDSLTGNVLSHFFGSHSPRQGLALAGTALIASSHVSPTTASLGFIRLYNWWSSAAFHSIPAPEPVAPIVGSSDGVYLFSGGISGRIHAFALPSGDLRRSFRAHCRAVSCLAIDEVDSLLVSAGEDGTIAVFPLFRILDVSSEENDSASLAFYQLSAHDSGITGIALRPGGGCNGTIVSSSLDGTCKFWAMANGAHLRTVRFTCEIWCVVVDLTNYAAFAGGSDGRVHAIPIKTEGRKMETEVVAWGQEQSRTVTAVAMADGNRKLVSASEDGIVRIWEVASGAVVRVFGQERVSGFSNLSVARSISNDRVRKEGSASNWERNLGFAHREICGKDSDAEEMDESLSVVMKDRRKAMDMLEVAIGTYENLLAILLKEAKGSARS